MSRDSSSANGIQLAATRFSLFWLAAANLVGVWLAWLLVYPGANDWLAPLSYGRWMPLHMDWHLYGWSSLPLLGLLMARYWEHRSLGVTVAGLSFALWSVALLLGGFGWLFGQVQGKPFLNWAGSNRWVFVAALALVWALNVWGWGERWIRKKVSGESIRSLALLGGVALMLLSVPFALFFTSDATVYPPVDPDSGGATGHSLLASTLGIVALMGVIPAWGLKLRHVDGPMSLRVYWVAFVLSIAMYLMIEHGNASNRALNQIFGLGSLLVWPGLVAWLWSGYEWGRVSRLWRYAFFFWWGLLAVNGWLTFLPGILDTLKFTNGLVAHTHLAMAGMVSAMNMVVLVELGEDRTVGAVLGNERLAWVWNLSVAFFVILMFWQGLREGVNPGVLFRENALTQVLYWGRLLAGIAMAGCSFVWLWRVARKEKAG